MPQSFASIHLHIVFSTKNREAWLTGSFAEETYKYIGGTLRKNGCVLVSAGGMPDHVHLLVSMSREVSAAQIVRNVKSNSSRWIHETFAEQSTFAWQAGYGAFAVSYPNLTSVRDYIANQKSHHTKETYKDEFRSFLLRHAIEWDEKYVWD